VLGIPWFGLKHPGTYIRKSRIAKDLFGLGDFRNRAGP